MIKIFNSGAHIARSSVAFVILLTLLFGAFPVSACGCGVMISSSEEGWEYGDDSDESSFINFENGIEKLIISLDIKQRSKDAVLVIPIPSAPDLIKADVLSETPSFSGYDVRKKARENLSSIRDALLSTQIYPVIPIIIKYIFTPIGSTGSIVTDSIRNAPSKSLDVENQDIVVYQHLEKEGMVAEVLSAATSDALYNYLTQKGLKVEKDSIPILQDYIHKDFSFVVSWISPSTKIQTAKGVMMNFPAKKIFYPLKPGSAYSGKGMDKTILVAGYVSPKLYDDIKSTTNIDYFYSFRNSSLKDFFSSDGGFGFTKITINAEPQKLTQDLYISNHAPLHILNAHAVNLYPVIYGFLLLIILSFIATYLASRFIITPTQSSVSIIKLGLINCLTLLGTIIGSRIFLKEKRSRFVLFFSAIFCILILVVISLMSLLYK